jgi:23S rRNA pseudouridine2457 synthase
LFSYFCIYKPFQVISGFTPENGKPCLKDFFEVPADVYPLGRLDFDSEGLLLLTNDKSLNYRILHPSFAHEREYWVQVEGDITEQALNRLRQGLSISIDGKKYNTNKTRVALFTESPPVPERNPPIRFRKNIPTSWISLILTEGKNRQVRKMTAAVGFPTLRLIRYRISGLSIQSMLPGDMVAMDKRTCYHKLGLDTLI